MDELTDEQLAELSATHGDVREVRFVTDDEQIVSIVLRKPVCDRYDSKKDEFLETMTKRFVLEQTPRSVVDPTDDGTREMLACVVYPDPMAVRAHLRDFPGDAGELRDAYMDLAGARQVDDAPELVTEHVRGSFHRRAIGRRVAGKPLVARPLSAAEYAAFIRLNGGRVYPTRADALCWAAWSCVQEPPGKDKRKPEFDALLTEVPMLGIILGMELIALAQSRRVDREKKSVPPSPPPPPNLAAEG